MKVSDIMDTLELIKKIEATPCGAKSKVGEPSLNSVFQANPTADLNICQTNLKNGKTGYYIAISYPHSPDQIWYLCTRREDLEPRIFKNLERLCIYLKGKVPIRKFTIYIDMPMPS